MKGDLFLLMLQGNPVKVFGINLSRYGDRHAGAYSCKELTISLVLRKKETRRFLFCNETVSFSEPAKPHISVTLICYASGHQLSPRAVTQLCPPSHLLITPEDICACWGR